MALPNGGTATIIDDYGHHPVEMAATIAARAAPFDKRLVLAFQPHRYTRTRDCFEDFVKVLSTVDALLLGEVMPPAKRRSWPPTDPLLARALRVGARSSRSSSRHRGDAAGDPGRGAGWRRGDHDGCRHRCGAGANWSVARFESMNADVVTDEESIWQGRGAAGGRPLSGDFLMSGGAVLALQAAGVNASIRRAICTSSREQGYDRAFIALMAAVARTVPSAAPPSWMGIPYTGSGVMARPSAWTSGRTKLVWLPSGLPTPRFAILDANTDRGRRRRRSGPADFVKPCVRLQHGRHQGVTEAGQLKAAWELAAKFDSLRWPKSSSPARSSPPLPGRPRCCWCASSRAGGNYDYQNKYFTDDTQYFCPSGLPEAEKISRLPSCAAPRCWAAAAGAAPTLILRDDGSFTPARDQHRAGHDQPLAGAHVGTGGRIVVPRPVPRDPPEPALADERTTSNVPPEAWRQADGRKACSARLRARSGKAVATGCGTVPSSST